ncbi:cardiolipin synthase [Gilliamella sp. Choc4-2]|jgi:cardiolipin synthase A/B|uniref:cardiolipin synthase n=1 Tax=unclassified Gilliamella TaxID=2685620 RepID=UPI00080E2DD1|nr:cardiolipin synthase [Gilliamella apicola]OCG30012.1 cardiolipin synthase [Gilliamella apicola]OCG43637.1 cardiolipin synthase [Gilliamella apicola]OCG53486.1 cardiolipin synthase [Gilliamella apicola]OCG64535.1 cardiolipin synthase [Gilliamella apicola]
MQFSSFHALISTLIFLVYWLIIVATTLRVVFKRRPTTYVIAWMLVIYILPIVGVILYFALGETHLGQQRVKRSQKMRPTIVKFINRLSDFPNIFTNNVSAVSKPIFQLCKHQTGLDGINGNHIELLSDTDSIFDRLIEDINKATSNIEMVFYIWNEGGRANDVEQALIQATKRGVICRLMIDSAGSRHFIRTSASKRMREAGIIIIEALQVNLLRFMFRRLDLRQHRKVAIIDNYISYTGSMNIVDPRFFKQNKHVGEWVDIMVRMSGPVTTLMGAIYASDWVLETGNYLALPQITDFAEPPEDKKHIMQLIASGPGYMENMIHQALLTAIYSAQEQIIFTTPYLVPSDDILHAVCTAAQRGVEVIIIIPKKNDSLMVKWASRAFFSELLEGGVKLYQFNDNLLHTKSVLIDNQLSLVGTVNLDMRSLWLNFEITAVIDDAEFAKSLSQLLQKYLSQSDEITFDDWKKRPIWQHIVERLFYFFAPLL